MKVDSTGNSLFEYIEALASSLKKIAALEKGNRVFSFAEVRDSVTDIVMNLTSNGFSSIDTVGISVRDEINHFLLSLSLLTLGAKQITLASHDHERISERLRVRLGITKVITDGDMIGLLDTSSTTNSHMFQSGQREGTLILKTSGTVSRAKLVPSSTTALLLQSRQHDFYRDSVFLRLASVEHNNSKRHRLYCFLQGGTNIFRESFEAVVDHQYLVSSRCTRLDVARSHFAALISDRKSNIIPEHVSITLAGSPASLALRTEFINQVSPNLFVRYGATESGTIAIAGPSQHKIEGGVGSVLDGVSHNATRELGNLQFQTPGMALEYLDPQLDQIEGLANGWFSPGDLGHLSDDGQLVISGRQAEAFTLDGINIFPREIEAVLSEHPAIADVAVVMKVSKNHDGLPVAYVVLSGEKKIPTLELMNWSREHLGLASPRQIILTDAIPTTDQGKIDFESLKNA
jgi:acyl-coenzyme A synthetase/AMP-(fatty) acid ligase